MTQRDYIKIAAALKAERKANASRCDVYDAAHEAVSNLTRTLADIMAADNPRFDRQRFYAAAGMSS